MPTITTKIESARGCGEAAWAAGLFEGEGSLSVIHNTGRPSIQFSMTSTDLDVLEKFVAIIGAGKIYGPYQKKGKPQYLWRAHGWGLLHRVYAMFKPWMGERRTKRFKEVLQLEPPPYQAPPQLRSRKLSSEQVLEVKNLLNNGESQHKIATRFNVSQHTISTIKRGLHYREL